MTNNHQFQTNTTPKSTRRNRSFVAILATCIILALAVAVGAMLSQSQQSAGIVTRLAHCNQLPKDWVILPYQVQKTLADNCATAEAVPIN